MGTKSLMRGLRPSVRLPRRMWPNWVREPTPLGRRALCARRTRRRHGGGHGAEAASAHRACRWRGGGKCSCDQVVLERPAHAGHGAYCSIIVDRAVPCPLAHCVASIDGTKITRTSFSSVLAEPRPPANFAPGPPWRTAPQNSPRPRRNRRALRRAVRAGRALPRAARVMALLMVSPVVELSSTTSDPCCS